MMYKYVLTHQPNLVGLYALGRWVARMLLAYPFRRVRLIMMIVIRKHILGDIGGQLIGTLHQIVPFMGQLALPHIWHLTLPHVWHLTLPINRHLALPRCRALALYRCRHLSRPHSQHRHLPRL
jgi:hypothetical protein